MGFWGAAAAVAPSIVSGIGNIVAGNEAADAAKDAARDNSRTQMRMFNEANRLSAPARIAGDRMRDEQLALMGLAPTASYSETGAPTQGGNYVAGNSDLQNAFATLSPENKRHLVSGGFDTDGDGQISADEFGRFHYQRHGQGEGRTFESMTAPGSDSGAYAAPGAQDAAYQRFLDGGFARSMLETTQSDMDMMMGAYGAGGTAMSGSTLGALNDSTVEFTLDNLDWIYLNGPDIKKLDSSAHPYDAGAREIPSYKQIGYELNYGDIVLGKGGAVGFHCDILTPKGIIGGNLRNAVRARTAHRVYGILTLNKHAKDLLTQNGLVSI